MPTAVSEEERATPNPVVESDEPVESLATTAKEESFKQLLREFVMGDNQNPDSAPGLQFYVVFAALIAAALGFVIILAVIMGVINLFRG
jgi:hypothetical protein